MPKDKEFEKLFKASSLGAPDVRAARRRGRRVRRRVERSRRRETLGRRASWVPDWIEVVVDFLASAWSWWE